MKRLDTHKKALYELRFSPMCKPAGEVSNLTQQEGHTTRAHVIMMWRVAEDMIDWGPREAELLYESTLDSISEAFDVFHYPISRYMLDARADVWDAGLAPDCVKEVVAATSAQTVEIPPIVAEGGALLLASEIAQLGDTSLLDSMRVALQNAGVDASSWVAPSGALTYALGAHAVAKEQALKVMEGIRDSGAQTIIADGPETAWVLKNIYPAFDLGLAEDVTVRLLSEVLAEAQAPPKREVGTVFVHDSRPAYLIADGAPDTRAILPGHFDDESIFGSGIVYEAPRHIVDSVGGQRVFGTWTRALAKSSGSDDGLWLTHPGLAAGLAEQRLDYAVGLGAAMLVTDSPIAAAHLSKYVGERPLEVKLLSELLVGEN